MGIEVELVLLVLSLLLLVSIAVSKADGRFGVPVLLIFLGVGMLFGQDGLGGIHFDNLRLARSIGIFALCVILFSGGLHTKIDEIRPVLKEGAALATIGVILTTALTGFFIWQAGSRLMPHIEVSLMWSMLLAAVMASTDSASIFALLSAKGLALKNNLQPLLELESGSNDAMAYMLTISLISAILSGNLSPLPLAMSIVIEITVGALAGYIFGKLAVRLINKINLHNETLYPILLFAACIFIFSATHFIHGNGYLAVYVGGLIVGNSKFITKRSSLKFFDVFAWMAQIMMFLTLGLLVNPMELLPVAIPALAIALFLTVVARPVAVFASLIPFRAAVKDNVFVSWVGLRGAVPIVFAILPMAAGVPYAREMFNIVFFVTLVSLAVQGTFLTKVASWLHLIDDDNVKHSDDFDLEFREEIKSAMTELTLTEEHLKNGANLMGMSLPDKTLAVMVKRGGRYFIPKGNTELHPNDKLLIITDDENALAETYRAMGIEKYSVKKNE